MFKNSLEIKKPGYAKMCLSAVSTYVDVLWTNYCAYHKMP